MAATQTLQTVISINARTGNGFSAVGTTLTELGAMVDGLSQELISFGKDSIEVYRNYEKSIKDTEVALSTVYGRGTRKLSAVMGKIDEQATEWAASSIFHTNDVANAISEAAHAGWDYNQILSGIPAAMQLAQAGGLDLSEAVNYIVKSTTAAGVAFEDLSDFTDLWAFAANSSASTIGEFGEAMLRMGSTMRFTGSTEELMTLLAVTANAGTVGSEAGTMIRNTMLRLIAPTDKAAEEMALLGATSEEAAELLDDEALAAANAELAARGFSAYNANGELKDMLDIYRELYVALADIAGGYEGIDRNQDALQVLAAIFPTRTITEALTLLRSAAEGYDGLYEAMLGGAAQGYGEYAAETMMDTLDGRIETFLSKVERLKQLAGEELSGPVGDALSGLGGIVDSIAGLDEGKFSILMRSVEGIAAAGPAILATGSAFRLISTLGTPLGATAALITAGTSLIMALNEAAEINFESHFGDMELDLAALQTNVDSLTTDAEQQVGAIEEYVTRISELSEEYKTAMTAFSADLSTHVLTGKELTQEEKDSLLKYGESITDTVIEGINTRKESSLIFLNAITPDAESMTDEEFAAYDRMYGWLTGYFGGLQEEAERIGGQLQQAIFDGLDDDGVIDEKERSVIQKYTDMLNRINSTILQAEYYSELEKAGRISEGSMEEYIAYLGENHAQRIKEITEAYDSQIGFARAAYEDELGHKVSDEEWKATDQYELYQSAREEGIEQIDSQTAELARTAVESIMSDSDMSDTWNFLEGIVQEAPRDKSGYISLTDEDWLRYFAEDAIPENFLEDIRVLRNNSSTYARMLKNWENDPAISDLYNMFGGTGDISEISSQAHDFQDKQNGFIDYNRFGYYVGDDGLEHTVLEAYGYQYAQPSETVEDTNGFVNYTQPIGPVQMPAQLYSDGSLENTLSASYVPLPTEPYIEGKNSMADLQPDPATLPVEPDVEEDRIADLQLNSATLPVEPDVEEDGMADLQLDPATLPVEPDVEEDGMADLQLDPATLPVEPDIEEDGIASLQLNPVPLLLNPRVEWGDGIPALQLGPVPLPVEPYVEGEDRIAALREQGVQVQVSGDTQQLHATIDGEDGQNLMAYVDGDATGLEAEIWSQDGLTLLERVTGDASALAALISSYNGRTVTVNVAGQKMFASGGRATTASVFGEAGPEWAIPEEHSERTAELLNAARAASGFTWPELLQRYGGLNAQANAGAGSGGMMIVYSPVINANDAAGVEEALREDKKRFERWFEEKRMRDEMEVYQ